MEDYYEYLDSNGVTTLYKLIKDDTVALIDSYSVTINGITTTLDTHINDSDIHTPISDIEYMVDTKISGLVNSAPETLDTLKELSDALGNDPNFATTVANQIGTKASKDSVYTKEETDTLLEGKANSVHTHVVKDITDFPTIPTKVSELSNDSNFVTSTELHDYATKDDLNSKQDALSEEQLSNIDSIPDKANKSDLSTVATSGSYKDLLDKPVIPEGADLSDYYNKGETDNLLNSKANTSDLAVVAKSGNYNDLNNTPIIPTKTSQLINDSGFLTSSSGVITSVSWSDIKDKPNFSTVATSGSYNDLSNKPTIPNVYNKTLTIQKNGTNVATFTSNSNTDVTANITVPTKVSELSNDSGFITGISWDKVTNKPTLATVATSGSYTDLSNTPAIPTKVSQLENDTGFVSGLTDVVDTKSNQTINGTKTFTSGPWVINSQTTMGFSVKNTALARNDVPSEYQHHTFRAYDKNSNILGEYCIEKSTNGDALLNMGVRSEDSSGNQIAHGLQFRMTNDGSVVRFIPSSNNKVHLGDVGAKWLKVHSDDVVHTSGAETIDGAKTFTQGIKIKNSDIDLTITPTSNKYSTYLFTDKNNANTASLQYSQRTYGVNDICFYVFDADSNSHGFRIRTDNVLESIANNTYSLGSSSNKWANVYSTNNITNKVITYSVTNHDNTSSMTVSGGSSWDTGSTLFLYGNSHSNYPGAFNLTAKNTTNESKLIGFPNGTLTWGGKNVAIDENLVHRSGNETINGVKYFDSLVYLHNNMSNKNSQMDLFTTPANTLYSHYMFVDKNNEVSAYMQYGQQNTGTDFIGLFIHDKNRALHGIQVTSNNYLLPFGNNIYNLGSPNNAWANSYITRMYCANILRPIENSYIYMAAGPSYNNGASIFLNGKSGDGLGTGKGTFLLFARDGTNERRLLGYPNGILSWNGCIESLEFRSTTANAFMGQYGSYTFLIRNDGNNTYFLMSDKDGVPGTWSTARPLIIDDATGVCNINGNANSATYSTTQAASDNSTKIATTAWVRTYVNSVVGNNTVGSSVSAYWSNSSNVTATGQTSAAWQTSATNSYYPAGYSEYITKTPVVGTIYSGAQLYSVLNAYASAKGTVQSSGQYHTHITSVTAQATFSNPISSTGKYLCTTANTVRFRAYAPGGNSVGTASVIENSSTKSIFIRVE